MLAIHVSDGKRTKHVLVFEYNPSHSCLSYIRVYFRTTENFIENQLGLDKRRSVIALLFVYSLTR